MNAGCLPLVIQMPIIFGLIGVIYNPLTYALEIPKADITALTAIIIEVFPKLAKSRTLQLTVIENIDKIGNLIAHAANIAGANLKSVNELVNSIFHLTGDSVAKLTAENVDKLGGLVGDISKSSIASIEKFNFTFLGLPLGQIPDKAHFDKLWAIPILSGITSLATGVFTWLKQKQTNPEMAKNPAMGCMTFGMPLFSTYFTFLFPVGIGIYWIASNVFAFIQTVILSITHNPKKMIAKLMIEEAIQRRSKEENLKLVASRKEQ